MEYNTDFNGTLTFKEELTDSQLALLNKFLDEDCRDHPEWLGAEGLTWVNLQLVQDLSGVEWNGDEKSYDMVEKVNMVTTNMRQVVPGFTLQGSLEAQGEDMDDRWVLVMDESGAASRKEAPQSGDKVVCPHCEEHFYI